MDVAQKANSLGFTKRIEFTDLNVAKFYKIIEEPAKPYWYHYRICAQHGGTTPIVYNAEMANVSGLLKNQFLDFVLFVKLLYAICISFGNF